MNCHYLKYYAAVMIMIGFSCTAKTDAAPEPHLPDGANTVYVDSTYRPAAYNAKLTEFSGQPISKTDIVFIGNSITAGTDWGGLLNMSNAKNRGISGDITYGVLNRLEEIIQGKPLKVFILIGINDIARNIPESYIINNYKRIIQKIKSGTPETKIYFHTLLPVNNSFSNFPNHVNKDSRILAVNNGLKELALQEEIILVDSNNHFKDNEGKLDKSYTKDGLHLTPNGYEHWASLLKKYIDL